MAHRSFSTAETVSLPQSLMMRFDLRVISPSQKPLSELNDLLSRQKGWFLNTSDGGNIHPFFRKEIFSNVEINEKWDSPLDAFPVADDFYDRLRPALKLATAMLKRSRDFWVLVSKAPITIDPATQTKCFTPKYLNQNLRPFYSEIDKALELMAQTTRVCWFETDTNQPLEPAGETLPSYVPCIDHRPYRLRLRMALCDSLVAALADPNFDNKPAVEQCAVYINIAITLLHELAHCLHLHRHREELITGYETFGRLQMPPEPSLAPSLQRELGFMFEISLMGGVVRTGHYEHINAEGRPIYRPQYDGTKGLQLHLPAANCRTHEEGYTISENSIVALLHENTWRPRASVPLYLIPMRTTALPAPGMTLRLIDSYVTTDQTYAASHGLLINKLIPVYRSMQNISGNRTSSRSRVDRPQHLCQKHLYSQASILPSNNQPFGGKK